MIEALATIIVIVLVAILAFGALFLLIATFLDLGIALGEIGDGLTVRAIVIYITFVMGVGILFLIFK